MNGTLFRLLALVLHRRVLRPHAAQVAEIVPLGELDPEVIVTPGIFVQRVVKEAA